MTDETLFAEVLEKGTAAERAAFLAEACDDPEQRARVESLLVAHDRATGFLNRPVVAPAEDGSVTYSPADSEITRDTDQPDELLVDAAALLSPSTRPDSLGRIGHYEVLEILGQGGFGIVYRAYDDKLQRVAAVKVMAPHLAVTSPARKRFLREARSAAAVDHPNVVRVYAVEEQPLPYLVMEYIPGETLQGRLDRTGPVDVSECVRVGRQIAAGLAAAHEKGLIHRDIKPSNILVDRGPTATTKITDFGLARAADDASLTRSGTVAGTPMYMAPEQARGETLDHRADLFSLGSVLYQMASGRPPFRASSTLGVLKRVAEDTPRPIREIIPEVPDWYCRIVQKLHAKNPADRFQTAREVADLLADCEKQLADGDRLTDTSRIPGGSSTARPRATKPRLLPAWAWALFALACVTVPLAALLSWVLYAYRSPGPVTTSTGGNSHGAIADGGFTPLFNGKDLSGWTEFPAGRGSWQVENGVLVGRGKPSHLFTEQWDFANFHLRIELRVNGGAKGGALGVFGRVPVQDPAIVLSVSGDDGFSLNGVGVPKLYPEPLAASPHLPAARRNPVVAWGADLRGTSALGRRLPPDEWVTCEVILDGASVTFTIWERGASNTFSGLRGELSAPTGHIALQLLDDWSTVEIRKIEVKELPSTAQQPGGLAPQPDADRLKGEWVAVTTTRVGMPVTENNRARVETFLDLDNGRFEMTTAGVRTSGLYLIDTARKEVVLTPVGAVKANRLRYELENDRLKLTSGGLPAQSADLARLHQSVQSANNLKQLAFAFHVYFDTHNTFPAPAVISPKGERLLSWRVTLLPHLGHDDLYKQFKLDEPWDSEHNKKLIAKMPKFYDTPGANAAVGQTHYQAFTGPGTALEVDEGGRTKLNRSSILDGTSSTLLFAEAAEPVVWTKPDDFVFDPNKLPKLGVSRDGVNVAFCDGVAVTLATPLKDDTLRALITANGGERVDVPGFQPFIPDNRVQIEFVRADFRPLFNGKDLSGWMAPVGTGLTQWKLEGTELVGRNRKDASFWNLGVPGANFHLRAEVQLTGTGDAGLYFTEGNLFPPSGMSVDLSARKGVRFGSLVKGGKVVAESRERAAPADWLRLEVIAAGQSWRVLIDGRQVAEYHDPAVSARGVSLLLQQARNFQPGDDLVIRFRKMEIRQLPVPGSITK